MAIIDVPGLPRSSIEMNFVTRVVPCPGCGHHDEKRLDISGNSPWLFLFGTCSQCGAERKFRFHVGNTRPVGVCPPPFQLGGPEPSRIIRPVQFVEEMDRVAPRVVWEPESLGLDAWHANEQLSARVRTCLHELLKFIPDGADDIPAAVLDDAGQIDRAARPERYRRGWLAAELERYAELWERHKRDVPRIQALRGPPPPPPRGEMSRKSADAHRQWLLRGRTGEGRLDVARVNVAGKRLGAVDLSGARLDGVVLERTDASFCTFNDAELLALSAAGANLGSCRFERARLERCNFSGAYLALAWFTNAVISGGKWDRVMLDRALLDRARFEGVDLSGAEFANARLDHAKFADCDLRGAGFALRATPMPLGTTAATRFERCDLRDTRWNDRDLTGAIFTGCRFHGASGKPRDIKKVRIERPDLSPAGDGSAIGRRADVLALWRGADGA